MLKKEEKICFCCGSKDDLVKKGIEGVTLVCKKCYNNTRSVEEEKKLKERYEIESYVGGWILAMKEIGADLTRENDYIRRFYSKPFHTGYCDAKKFFKKDLSELHHYAYSTRLLRIYKSFDGQSDFVHPDLEDTAFVSLR